MSSAGTFTVELLSLGGQPEAKFWQPFFFAVLTQRILKLIADRRCHNINACKLIRSNIPSIVYTVKNTAVPNSWDIQQFSSSQRRANGTRILSTHRLVSHFMLVTLTSLFIAHERAWLHVCMVTLLWLWKYWIWRKLWFETLTRLGSGYQKHYGS